MAQKFVKREPSGKWSDMLMDRAMRSNQTPGAQAPEMAPEMPSMNPEMFDPMSAPRAAAPMGAAAAAGGASPWLAPALAALLYPRSTAESSMDERPLMELLGGQASPASEPNSTPMPKVYRRQTQLPTELKNGRPAAEINLPGTTDEAAAGSPGRGKDTGGEGQAKDLDYIRSAYNAMRALKRDDNKSASGVQTPSGSDMTPMTMDDLIKRREKNRSDIKRGMR